MKFPVLKKCCFCLPLKKGLLTIGYLQLVTGILGMLLSAAVSGYTYETVLSIVLIFIMNTAFDITLIMAGHKESFKLFKICFYYAIAIWLILVATFALAFNTDDVLIAEYCLTIPIVSLIDYLPIVIDELFVPICNLLFQTYLLLLIRSEMTELTKSYDLSENNLQETEKNTNIVTDV